MDLPAVFTKIVTDRFVLRPLDVCDVTDRYAGWLGDQETNQYITTSTSKPDLRSLREYVLQRSNRADILFLGIFEKYSGLHIGNIKFEPVCPKLGYATMGILVGESDWRGKGVAAEVIKGSVEWLRKNRNIRKIVLGVKCANIAAIVAYKKVGFIEEDTEYIPPNYPEAITMVWYLSPV